MSGLQVHRWNLKTGKPLPDPEGHAGSIADLEFSADGTILATISQEDSTLRTWDVPSGNPLETFSDAPATNWPQYERPWQARSVAWFTDREIAAMPINNGVRVFSLNDPPKVRDFRLEFGNDSPGYLTTLTVEGNTLVVATGEHIYLLGATNFSRIGRLDEHWGAVWQLQSTPDGRFLASGGLDRAVVLWDMKTKSVKHVLEGARGNIRSVSLSSDAGIVTASSDEGDSVVWNGHTGKVLHHFLKTSDHGVGTVAVSPDGRLLAAGSNQLRFYDAISGEEKLRITELGAWVHQLAFSPDGSILASAVGRGGPILWNVKRLLSAAKDSKPGTE
jgi:WD40 repeat protein